MRLPLPAVPFDFWLEVENGGYVFVLNKKIRIFYLLCIPQLVHQLPLCLPQDNKMVRELFYRHTFI